MFGTPCAAKALTISEGVIGNLFCQTTLATSTISSGFQTYSPVSKPRFANQVASSSKTNASLRETPGSQRGGDWRGSFPNSSNGKSNLRSPLAVGSGCNLRPTSSLPNCSTRNVCPAPNPFNRAATSPACNGGAIRAPQNGHPCLAANSADLLEREADRSRIARHWSTAVMRFNPPTP